MTKHALISLLCLTFMSHAWPGQDHEGLLRTAEETVRLAVIDARTEVLAEFWSQNLIINTPRLGLVANRDRVLNAFETGAAGYHRYEQNIELIRIDGDTAVITGNEIAQTGPETDPVRRRFTHVWILREGQWRLLGRHAHLID